MAGRLLPCPPACQKGFFDKQKNAAFRRCRVLLQIYLVIPDDFTSIFGGSFYIEFLSNLISAAVAALNIIEKLLMIGLGVKALNQGTIAVPVVDNLISKYMG